MDNELHIGMEVPRHTARQIHRWAEAQPWPDGTELEPPQKYHVTLLYANDGHDGSDQAFWIEHMDEVEVTIDGMTVFPARHKDDGSYAYVFLINSPEVLDHAMMLQSRAKAWGIPVAEYPGGFHLHMTIAYGPSPHIPGVKAPDLAFHIGPSSISPKRVKDNPAESVRGVSDGETHNRDNDERDEAGKDQSWDQTLQEDQDEAGDDSKEHRGGSQHQNHVEPESSEFFHEDRVAYVSGDPIEPLNALARIARKLHETDVDPNHLSGWSNLAESLLEQHGYEPNEINMTAAVEAWFTLYPEDDPLSEKIAATGSELSQTLRHYSAPEPGTPLYHWTDASELHNWMDPAHTGPGKTYLTQSGDVEDWNDDVPHYEKPVRVQIDHSQLDPNAFDQDYHGWLGNYLYHGAIPQQAISEIKSFKRPESWDMHSTIPTAVNDPADHWPEFGEMPPDKHQDIEFSNDWAWHQ